MDERARELLRRAALSGNYDDVVRALGAVERRADRSQRLSAARTALREAYFSDVRELAMEVATPYKAARLEYAVTQGPLEERVDSGSRYALGLPVSWHNLHASISGLDQAIGNMGRLSSPAAMHDVVALSFHGRHAMSDHSQLDLIAEIGLLRDVSAEANRMVRTPRLPPIGSRVRFSHGMELAPPGDVGNEESEDQFVPRGATGTVVNIDMIAEGGRVVVWLDDVDFSESHDYEVELFHDEISALERI